MGFKVETMHTELVEISNHIEINYSTVNKLNKYFVSVVTERGLHNFAPVFALLGQSIASATRMLLWLHAVKTFPTGVRYVKHDGKKIVRICNFINLIPYCMPIYSVFIISSILLCTMLLIKMHDL